MLSSAEHFVMKAIEKLGGLQEIDESVELIQEYLKKDYHQSKNKRLAEWNPDKGEVNELVLVIFTACLQNKSLTYQAISGISAGRIDLDDHIDAVKTAAECVALISKTGLIDIIRNSRGNYIMVGTQYALDGIPEPDRHEVLYDQPPVFDKNWHEDYGHRVLGGKCNHHNEDICLDHINRMNAIVYALNKPLLRKYEEAPTFAFTDKYGNFSTEKRDQWQHFIRNSYRKYIEVSHKGNRFYLNHNNDKRGRCYAQGYHLNTQGSSFKKAVIQLAEAEIVEV